MVTIHPADSVNFVKKETNKKLMAKPVIIYTANELIRIQPDVIVYAISEGNYTTLVLIDLTEHVFSFNLSHLELLLHDQLGEENAMFIRTGKRLIINREYVYKVNIGKKQLILADIRNNLSISLTASKVALRQLKSYLESQLSLPSSTPDSKP